MLYKKQHMIKKGNPIDNRILKTEDLRVSTNTLMRYMQLYIDKIESMCHI